MVRHGAPWCHSADRTGAEGRAATPAGPSIIICATSLTVSICCCPVGGCRGHRAAPPPWRFCCTVGLRLPGGTGSFPRECDGRRRWEAGVAVFIHQVRSSRPDQPDDTKLQSEPFSGSPRLEVRKLSPLFYPETRAVRASPRLELADMKFGRKKKTLESATQTRTDFKNLTQRKKEEAKLRRAEGSTLWKHDGKNLARPRRT